MSKPVVIKIDEVEYVRKDSLSQKAEQLDGMDFVVIRTYSAGVHIGYLASRNGREVVLRNAIRIHYWDGAASLSQMAAEGVKKPANCRFSVVVPSITLTEAIEVIPCTEQARVNLQGVKTWKI